MTARVKKPLLQRRDNSRVKVWVTRHEAVWTSWRQGRCVEQQTVSIDDTPCCPWPDHGSLCCPVELYVDAGAADIERLASPGFGRGPLGRWQRVLFDMRRAREAQTTHTPVAQVSWLGRHGSPLARAALWLEPWPHEIEAWVTQAREQGLVFGTAVSVPRLLACSLPWRAPPRLLVFTHAGLIRHIVCADGTVCLSRVVDTGDDTVDAVVASLEHVAERWGFVQVDVSLAADSQCTDADLERIARVCTGTQEQRRNATGDGVQMDPLVHDVLCPRGSYLSRQLLRLRARGRRARASGELQSAVTELRQRAEMRGLKAMVGLSLITAVAFAGYAAVSGFGYAQHVASVDREHAALLSELADIRAQSLGLDETPLTTVRILQRAAAIDQAFPLPASDLLGLVAGVLTAHPAIELDQLSWRVVPEASTDSEHLLSGDGAMHVEQQSWLRFSANEGSEPSSLRSLFELSGTVSSSEAIAHLQDNVQAFVDGLQRQPLVDVCQLLESPLTGVADGPVRVDGSGDASGSGWRLRCLLVPGAGDTDRLARR